MRFIKSLFSQYQESKRDAFEQQMRQEREALEADPAYYSTERYTKTIEPYLHEPVQKEYIIPKLISLMMISFREQGCIRSFGGGWRGYFGEEYIMMKSGWTPTVAEDKDPIIYFRKHQAAHHVARVMSELFQSGFTDKLLAEVLASIDKEFNK